MTDAARDLLEYARRELAPGDGDNRFVPLVARGDAPRAAIGALAAEQRHIIDSDWRSFLTLASRADDHTARAFFTALAEGERDALGRLPALAAAAGLDDAAVRGYEPTAGCQAYPAYQAWLALNGEPADVVLAVVANFAAWGGYCAAVADALRRRYGFDDAACAFFDAFAAPAPEVDEQAAEVIQHALDAGRDGGPGLRYGRLLQRYEAMFWDTLADLATGTHTG